MMNRVGHNLTQTNRNSVREGTIVTTSFIFLCSFYISVYYLSEWFKRPKMVREKSRRRRNKTVFLPKDLIIKIMLRLPVKSLVCCKCVCKSWLSLISDPHFANSHFELSAAHTHRILLLEPYTPTILSIDFNASLHDDSACAALNLNFPTINTIYHIMGSTRGFVLLDSYECFLVWNPSTSVYRQVSHSPNDTYPFLYGFGYDPSKDDYLVVQVSWNLTLNGSETRVEIFSLRANAWKEIEGLNLSYVHCDGELRTGCLLNGALHWLAFCTDVSMDVIIAFDLVERSFSEIPPPVDLVPELEICKMQVLGESLCLYIWRINHPVDIWVMKEYKVQSSWTKSFVVSVDDFPNRFFSVFCSTKSGDVVGSYGFTGLAKVNDEGQLLEHRSYCDRPANSKIMYTESLLSLPCDTEQAQEDE